MEMKKTIFLDIDGCLIKHKGNLSNILLNNNDDEIIDGTIEKLNEWESEGHKIILVTGRKESMRKKTIEQLDRLGIFYSELIMDINRGTRILINDKKPDNDMKVAIAYEIERNSGIKNIKL